MTGFCLSAGMTSGQFLAHNAQVEVIGVATDDVMHFSHEGPRRGKQWMKRLESVSESVGIMSNPDKDLAEVRNATCIGKTSWRAQS